MSDTYITARDYILGVFYSQWQIDNPLGLVDFQDKPFETPTGKEPWCRVTLRHSGGGQVSLTDALAQSKRFDNTGTLFLQLMAPIGDGKTGLLVLAQSMVKVYRTARHSNIWFRNVRIDDNIPTRGPWAQVNVIAEFTYDTIE